jgi:hypothetical protein
VKRAAAALVLFALAAPASAQPADDTAKFQPAILNLRGCIRSSAPAAFIAEVRTYDQALSYFLGRCYPPFSEALARLNASDAATGSYRLIVREEWTAFRLHAG